MDKKRLTGLIDAAFVLVAVHAVYNYIFYPNPRSWEGVWEIRHELYRTGVLLLWLAGLWTGSYRPWNAVKRVSQPAVLLGAGTALCVLGDYYFTGFIIPVLDVRNLLDLLNELVLFSLDCLSRHMRFDHIAFSLFDRLNLKSKELRIVSFQVDDFRLFLADLQL